MEKRAAATGPPRRPADLRTGRLLPLAKITGLVLFVGSTNHEVAGRLQELWARGHWSGLGVFLALWLACLATLALVAFSASRRVRLGWALPIAVSSLAGDLAFAVAKHPLGFYDVVLYWNERVHLAAALELYSSWLVAPAAKAAVGAICVGLDPGQLALRRRGLALAPALPLVLIAALLLRTAGGGTRALPTQFAPLAMAAVLGLRNPIDQLDGPRETVEVSPRRAPAAKHVVLVVDESVRPDYLDFEAPGRGITPTLARHPEVARFGTAAAGNNCSLFSNLILRFGGTPERLPERIRVGPSVWEFARRAGFQSVYLDGQGRPGHLQNGMTIVERSRIDRVIQPGSEVAYVERDHFLAHQLRDLLASDRPSFVFVNKRGSHFPYARNYPPEAAVFRPDMQPGEPIGEDRERLLNAYRNSVRWNTDGFFAALGAVSLRHSVLIYTSDHGQNLMDRGVVPQCNSSDPHPVEGMVPLFVLAGDPALRARFERSARRNRDRASHFEIFPTLLELFGFDPDAVRPSYGAGLLEPLPDGPRAFTYGPLIGLARDRIRWLALPSGSGLQAH